MSDNKIKVLIVDKSVIDRDIISKSLEDNKDIQVVGTAPTGNIGMIKTLKYKPDIVLFDVAIDDITSINFTIEILKKIECLGIILTSKKVEAQSTIETTINTLQNGAFDLVEKPENISEEKSIDILRRKLLPKIRTFSIQHYAKIAKIASSNHKKHKQIGYTDKLIIDLSKKTKYKLIAIGVSTGGPNALCTIIPKLPSSFPIPIVIVLHLPKLFTNSMAAELNKKSELSVVEAVEGEIIQSGKVYIAQGGRHLVIKKRSNQEYLLSYNDDPPENGCKPSVDVLFRSLSKYFTKDIIAVILTGMGSDGTKGISLLKDKGAYTIAQDKETSVVWGMPGSAVDAGYIYKVLPLESIFEYIMGIMY